jgi:hypothetical protein
MSLTTRYQTTTAPSSSARSRRTFMTERAVLAAVTEVASESERNGGRCNDQPGDHGAADDERHPA